VTVSKTLTSLQTIGRHRYNETTWAFRGYVFRLTGLSAIQQWIILSSTTLTLETGSHDAHVIKPRSKTNVSKDSMEDPQTLLRVTTDNLQRQSWTSSLLSKCLRNSP